MFNQVVLIGVLKSIPHDFSRDGMDYSQIEMEVRRSYRDPDSQPLYDIFTVHLWRGISEVIIDRYPIGSLIAIRGRLEATDAGYLIMAERVSFIQEAR